MIRFVLVATHTNSLVGVLGSLLSQGFDLSQIKFIYQPNAAYANIRFEQGIDSVSGEWVALGQSASLRHFNAGPQADLGTILQKHLEFK